MPTKPKSKLASENGFHLPKKAKCFQCTKEFYIKFVIPQQDYSKKNNWEYWTNPQAKDHDFWKDKQERQKDKQICDACLLKLYYNKEEYWETITDLRKRNLLRNYVHEGSV